jgi:hypothetical protein
MERCSLDGVGQGRKPIEGVRNIIARSNKAEWVDRRSQPGAFLKFGASVSLLDADLTGPNVPTMLGLSAGFRLTPASRYGRYGLRRRHGFRAKAGLGWSGETDD